MPSPSRWPCRGGLALAALLCVPCLAAPAPTAASSEDRAAESAAAEIVKKVPELIGVVEEYRGLRFARSVPLRTMSGAELGRKLAARLQPGDLEPRNVALEAFGLVPRSMDILDAFAKLTASETAGVYDWHDKELILITGPKSLFGESLARRHGAETAGRMREALVLHELTHAVQDQHFDLARLNLGDTLSDAAVARLALVEGDATLVALADIAGARPDDIPLLSTILQHMLRHPEQAMPLAPGVAGPANATSWLAETTLFTYFQGASFCARVLERGGQRLLDHAFRAHPPRSTKQILHPEQWLEGRGAPPTIAWPDLQGELPGYAKAADGQLGELGIRIWLQQGLHDAQRAEAAAAGWGGDRFAVYRLPASRDAETASRVPRPASISGAPESPERPATLLAWITIWETDQDAAGFAAEAEALGADWSVERTGARRVVVLRGSRSAASRAALFAKLAEAPVSLAAIQPVDAAAIDPKRKIGAAGRVTAARLAARQRQLSAGQPLPAGHLSQDRRTFSYPEVGLSIRLPPGFANWESKPSGPTVLLYLADPQGGSLTVNVIDLRRPGADLELVEKVVEQRMESTLPGFTKIDRRLVEAGGQRVYELRYSSHPGSRFQAVQRIFQSGTKILVVDVEGREDHWLELEPSARELLAGVTVSPPARPAGPPSAPAAVPEDIRPWQVQRPREVSRSSLEFRLVLDPVGPGPALGRDPARSPIELPGPEGTPLILSSEVVLTQGDITKTEVGPALETLERSWKGLGPAEFVVYLHLTPEAARRLHRLSGDNVGRRLAIVVDGRILMAPYMRTAVDSPMMIESVFTREAATRIAERLAP